MSSLTLPIQPPTGCSKNHTISNNKWLGKTNSSKTSLHSCRETPEQVLRKKLREELSDEQINTLLRKYPDITDFDDLMCLANTLFDDDLNRVFEASETLALSNQTADLTLASTAAEKLELKEKLLAGLDGNVKLVD
jgi:hypothetical protein